MRLKQPLDNGNLALHRGEVESRLNFDNSSWLLNNTANNSDSRTANSLLNSNYDGSRESSNGTESVDNIRNTAAEVNVVCNRQYRLNTENSGLFFLLSENKPTGNLEGVTQTQLAVRESFLGTSDASLSPSPLEEERAFSQSDTDEMSERSSQPVNPVPRGIVNPNYPGFQHLAHTLQDYSTNIDNFSLSENDMTDDDVDITDITENTYDSKDNNNGFVETKKNINNNTIYSETILACENHTPLKPLDIPDLLKTITLNNNNNTISHDYEERFPCTDIENNFDTKDIIGDFNKEIEDEIKQLLNYNINIQSDLEELKKDIKDNLAKPIENTINNISDVVNHVIKKLVETQGETCEQNDKIDEINGQREVSNTVNEENETNIRTEMSKINLSRPTFLLIDNNTHVIPDAFLSDGVEEININEEKYNIESISDSVDKTIQKLGTELRNIIPKLDEKHEQEIITVKETEVVPLATDGNSNEIATSSLESDKELPSAAAKLNVTRKMSVCHTRVAKVPATTKTASRKTSVHATESVQEADLGSFDVYNIETALPKLDFDAIESHLKAAKEAERRKHNDREEIRRRLATGVDAEDYHSLGHGDRPGRKPSLHSRLKSGKNLQICYMNETASDNESQSSEIEKNPNPSVSLSHSNTFSKSNSNHPYQTRPLSVYITKEEKLSTIQSAVKLRPPLISRSKSRSAQSLSHIGLKESDFYALQATLQTEARIALAQAKETARVQMERERRTRAVSPVTEMMRDSMQKAGVPLAADRRRVSRQLLTDMNVAQLQVIVNELHSQIEALNESLVSLLMARDELHMGQDSMLVDIEDLTRYLGVKEQTKKTKGSKSGVRRLTSFVHK